MEDILKKNFLTSEYSGFILKVGIVSKISTLLAKFKCNIVESKQFTDQQNGNFFIRQSFTLYDSSTLSKLEKNLNLLSNELNAELISFFFATSIAEYIPFADQ